MARLTRLDIQSAAKVKAAVMTLVGLVAGIVYSFGGLVYDLVTTGGVNAGTALAFMALVGMPVLFGAFGWVAGAAGALLFNLAARWAGGLEMDIAQ